MENESKIGGFFSRLGDRLSEQAWFQQMKAKWDELDTRTKLFAQVGGLGTVALLVVGVALNAIWQVRGLEQELSEKNSLLSAIQAANDEIRRLREAGVAVPDASAGTGWETVFQGIAAASNVDPKTLTISESKVGAGLDAAREALYDLTLTGINVRQLMRFAYTLENSAKPIKLRNLAIDTKEDMSGYLDATLSVSAFAPKEQ